MGPTAMKWVNTGKHPPLLDGGWEPEGLRSGNWKQRQSGWCPGRRVAPLLWQSWAQWGGCSCRGVAWCWASELSRVTRASVQRQCDRWCLILTRGEGRAYGRAQGAGCWSPNEEDIIEARCGSGNGRLVTYRGNDQRKASKDSMI